MTLDFIRALSSAVGVGSVLVTLIVVSNISGSIAQEGDMIRVTTEVDSVDAAPGDGACADAEGLCSLRAAIQESNASPGTQTIEVPAGTYRLTIPGRLEGESATGDLDVRDSTVIDGAGMEETVVSAEGIDRVMETFSPGSLPFSLTLRDLTLTGGHARFEPFVGDNEGGGLYNDGDFETTLARVAIRGNRADLFGGGIYSEHPTRGFIMRATDVEISDNHAAQVGGGVYGGAVAFHHALVEGNFAELSGGGISSTLSLQLEDSLVSANRAGNQGGISAGESLTVRRSSIVDNVASNAAGGIGGGGTWTIEDSVIEGNTAGGEAGGAFYTGGSEGATHVVIDRSAFVKNTAGLEGGGLYLWTGARVEITNTTFSANVAGAALESTASRRIGGAIFVLFSELNVVNSTLAENNAPLGSTIAVSGANHPRKVTVRNSIVFGGQDSCLGEPPDGGSNVLDSRSCLTGAGTDVLVAHPIDVLAPLAVNGPPVHPLAQADGSLNPAVDRADVAFCPAVDQRREVRPRDGDGDGVATCDVGSYELASSGTPKLPVVTDSPVLDIEPVALPRTGGSELTNGAP